MWDQLSDLTTICPWWISRGTTPKSGNHFRFGNRCSQSQMLVKIGGTIMKWWVFNGSTGFFFCLYQYTSQWWRIERHAIQWQRISGGQFDGLQDQSGLGLFFRLMMVGWRVSHEFPIKPSRSMGMRWGEAFEWWSPSQTALMRYESQVANSQSTEFFWTFLSVMRAVYRDIDTQRYTHIWYIRYIYIWAFITDSKPLTVGLGSPHWGSNSRVRQAWADHSVEPGRAIGAAR